MVTPGWTLQLPEGAIVATSVTCMNPAAIPQIQRTIYNYMCTIYTMMQLLCTHVHHASSQVRQLDQLECLHPPECSKHIPAAASTRQMQQTRATSLHQPHLKATNTGGLSQHKPGHQYQPTFSTRQACHGLKHTQQPCFIHDPHIAAATSSCAPPSPSSWQPRPSPSPAQPLDLSTSQPQAGPSPRQLRA
jgi:hypothetical protein